MKVWPLKLDHYFLLQKMYEKRKKRGNHYDIRFRLFCKLAHCTKYLNTLQFHLFNRAFCKVAKWTRWIDYCGRIPPTGVNSQMTLSYISYLLSTGRFYNADLMGRLDSRRQIALKSRLGVRCSDSLLLARLFLKHRKNYTKLIAAVLYHFDNWTMAK